MEKNAGKVFEGTLNAEGMKLGIVCARFSFSLCGAFEISIVLKGYFITCDVAYSPGKGFVGKVVGYR